MIGSHDPYLVTVQRGFDEKRIKERKKSLEENKKNSKGFFSKNITISDYIYLPESLQQIFLLNIFIFVPYLIGLFIIFVIINQKILHHNQNIDFNSFMLTWTIGYEFLAFTLLMLIIKSAVYFKKN